MPGAVGNMSRRLATRVGSLLVGATAGVGAIFVSKAALAQQRVALGDDHQCAVQLDGTLWCWGGNYFGQLGLGFGGSTTPALVPAQVTSIGSSVVEVAAGQAFTCARKQDGTVWCWGYGFDGELGTGTGLNETNPQPVAALGNGVRAVSAAGSNACALKTDGSVWCWGDGSDGALAPVQVPNLGNSVVQISTNAGYTCAVKADGTLWCWGLNGYGQLGDGTTNPETNPVQVAALGNSVAQVAAGEQDVCALKNDGTVWCWGFNFYGENGDGTTGQHNSPVQATVAGSSVTKVRTGWFDVCTQRTDGTLWCWGANKYGELGDGTNVVRNAAVQVAALGTYVVELAMGQYTSCATETDGTLWCWGTGTNAGLGDGTSGSSYVPSIVFGPCPSVTTVSASMSTFLLGGQDSVTAAPGAPTPPYSWEVTSNGLTGAGAGTLTNRTSPTATLTCTAAGPITVAPAGGCPGAPTVTVTCDCGHPPVCPANACGVVPDSCGNTINCSCSAPLTCNVRKHQCACPPGVNCSPVSVPAMPAGGTFALGGVLAALASAAALSGRIRPRRRQGR
jgi:alpha-tubulin suppressor-like RCC1 family protein